MQVRLDFDEPEPGVTIIRLSQNGVPEEDRSSIFSYLTFDFFFLSAVDV